MKIVHTKTVTARFLASCLPAVISLVAVGCGTGSSKGGDVDSTNPVLLDPKAEAMTETAPDQFRVRLETSSGNFVVEVDRDLAPHGADRFYNLVNNGFYDGCRFFRVVPNFIVQWGMHGDPKLVRTWYNASVLDDPVHISNERGTITFAKTNAPHSRTVQLFINLKDNPNLDGLKFAPFGRVVEGMDVVDAINPEYGEQPSQEMIAGDGNEYLNSEFPNLDYIKQAVVID
ncbi:MAG: peptidylprolyl isomerase [Candidatus Latescibacterota bacterium]|nr:peptidylprolyl isomerase [Candidatus Latescibacterota bacterium]